MLSLDSVLRFCAFLGVFGYLMQICIFVLLLKIVSLLKKQGINLEGVGV